MGPVGQIVLVDAVDMPGALPELVLLLVVELVELLLVFELLLVVELPELSTGAVTVTTTVRVATPGMLGQVLDDVVPVGSELVAVVDHGSPVRLGAEDELSVEVLPDEDDVVELDELLDEVDVVVVCGGRCRGGRLWCPSPVVCCAVTVTVTVTVGTVELPATAEPAPATPIAPATIAASATRRADGDSTIIDAPTDEGQSRSG